MKKEDLLRSIAETAYNVGFGAKKHFATHDIVSKAPGFISFFSLAFGIYALIFDVLNVKYFSATLIVLGVVSLYVSHYNSTRAQYAESGEKLTGFFNDLKRLYFEVKTNEGALDEQVDSLSAIEKSYIEVSSATQIIFSNWYAHYKFFCEQQIAWIDEQLNFKLFRDKIPFSLFVWLTIVVIFLVIALFNSDLVSRLCAGAKP